MYICFQRTDQHGARTRGMPSWPMALTRGTRSGHALSARTRATHWRRTLGAHLGHHTCTALVGACQYPASELPRNEERRLDAPSSNTDP